MKRILAVIISVMFLSISPIYSKRLAALPEVGNPHDMSVDNGQLFISDLTVKVHIYSLNDFKYQGQISRKGEGPGECKTVPLFDVGPDYIFLYSYDKSIFFSRDGKKSKRELKLLKANTIYISPLGENFIYKMHGKNPRNNNTYYDISIYTYTKEEGFKFKKMLYYYETPPRKRSGGKLDYNVIRDFKDYILYENNVFVGDSSRGLFVAVFDSQGNEIHQIKLDVKEIKVTEKYKKHLMNMLKRDPQWEIANSIYNIVFPEYFPAYYRFSVDNGKVYFLTYKLTGDNQREVIITDLKGNLLKRSHVPWIENELRIDYAIENDKFYYILANETTEDWELHMEEIK